MLSNELKLWLKLRWTLETRKKTGGRMKDFWKPKWPSNIRIEENIFATPDTPNRQHVKDINPASCGSVQDIFSILLLFPSCISLYMHVFLHIYLSLKKNIIIMFPLYNSCDVGFWNIRLQSNNIFLFELSPLFYPFKHHYLSIPRIYPSLASIYP